jgi:hypothetical protein
MDDKTTGQLSEPTIYEQLYRQLHAYNFGAIDFMDLLNRFEQILQIKPRPFYTEDAIDSPRSDTNKKASASQLEAFCYNETYDSHD